MGSSALAVLTGALPRDSDAVPVETAQKAHPNRRKPEPAVVAALAACVASTIGDHDGRHTTQAPAAAATPRARSATSAEVRQPRARADDATYQVSQRFVPSPLGIHTWLTCVLRRSWTSSTITAQWLSLSTG